MLTSKIHNRIRAVSIITRSCIDKRARQHLIRALEFTRGPDSKDVCKFRDLARNRARRLVKQGGKWGWLLRELHDFSPLAWKGHETGPRSDRKLYNREHVPVLTGETLYMYISVC